MYWEYYFFRMAFFAFMLLLALGSAGIGAVTALLRGKLCGIIQFFSKLAFAVAWGGLAAILLPYFEVRHSFSVFIVYTVWGMLGVVPFVFSLLRSLKNKLNNRLAENICGIVTVLIFSGSLSTVIYYSCIENGVLRENELFSDACMKILHFYYMLLAGLFFMPLFAIFTLVLGILRENFSGFLKNLLQLAVAPAGLLLFVLMVYYKLDKIQSGCFLIYTAIAIWILIMIIPYTVMLWYSKKEKDDLQFLNGISGVWSVIFFLLLMCISAYLGSQH
ncbi:MAG: hypothetical protein E7039_08750 [Lentisphaerae bacterium]|nr:hypothetical protein [Lentisphaerota bacterium]